MSTQPINPSPTSRLSTDDLSDLDRLRAVLGQPSRSGPQARGEINPDQHYWDLPDGHTVHWERHYDGSIAVSMSNATGLDRADGPASLSWYPNGKPEYAAYARDGVVQTLTGSDEPASTRWYPNGRVKEMEWRDGVNPGLAIRYDKNGDMTAKSYLDATGAQRRIEHYEDGYLHADGQHAAVVNHGDRLTERSTEEYWRHGTPDAQPQPRPAQGNYVDATPEPLEVWRDPDMVVHAHEHLGPRLDTPASTTGAVWRQRSVDRPDEVVGWTQDAAGRDVVAFYKAGKDGWQLHRDDGPALITFDPAGRARRAEWYQDGQLSRPYGPACQAYDEAGHVTYEERHLAGRPLAGPTATRHVSGQPVELGQAPDRVVTAAPSSRQQTVATTPAQRTSRIHQAAITGKATAWAEPTQARPRPAPRPVQAHQQGRRL